MKRLVRWLRNALIGLVVLVAIASLVIYIASERIVNRRFSIRATDVTPLAKESDAAEGLRLAKIRGCTGCHMPDLKGQMFIDDPLIARVASPNLTAAMREYSDVDLERIIRRGVRPDGKSVVVMPSAMFSPLTDEDLGKILAYLRSVPPVNGQARQRRLGPVARLAFVLGKFKPAAVEVREANALTASYPRPGEQHYAGAYLARTSCTECHGFDLRGDGDRIPDLRIAAGYTLDQFTSFMRTGKALGNRELKLMSDVARKRFSNFTDEEILQLHSYLVDRAQKD